MSSSLDVLNGLADNTGYKAPAAVASTGDLSSQMIGLFVVDGYQLQNNDRVLVWQNADPTTNGVYNAQSGAWTRAIDFSNTSAVTAGTQIFVFNGTKYGGGIFVLEDSNVTFGSSIISFSQLFGGVPKQNVLWKPQLLQGLATVDTGVVAKVAANIPSNPYDPVSIIWNGPYSVANDALYQFIQVQLGYSNSQMAAFWASCANYPTTPA